ncbi:MAG: hypothetical protein II767_01560, partial [Proteobacteria bacterium]|nr:hypothetical protein [Pseudomonadota bacterium]
MKRSWAYIMGLAALLPTGALAQQPGGNKADKAALSALESAGKLAESAPAGEAGQTAINDQAIALGVDPLSLITVTPGGPPVRIPIAVPDSMKIGDNIDEAGLGRALAEVIRNDLNMSGLFEVLPVETYALVNAAKEGVTQSTIQFDSWYNVGASVLVKAHYKVEHSKGEFEFAVFNIDSASPIPLAMGKRTVTPDNVRAVAHEFVNKLIGFFTGTDGVFGTRILFAARGKNNYRTIRSFETDGFGGTTYDLPEAINVMPEWGPKGSILFTQLLTKGDNIFLYENKELKQLTDFEGWASGADYCPKSGKIAFTGAREQNGNIYVMD